MPIVTVEQMQAQLNLPNGMDSDLLADKIAAAQDHIERQLGFKIADQFEEGETPASLIEAVKQLAAHWYESREAVIIGHGAAPVPYGVTEIINSYRDWSF